jgi:aldehyde dehydrogenase (NAD+)
MKQCRQFFIDGQWVDPLEPTSLLVENPATEEPIAVISLASKADVDRAVAAARRAFESFGATSPRERSGHIERLLEVYQRRYGEVARAISEEMGAPLRLCNEMQAATMVAMLKDAIELLKTFPFEERMGNHTVMREPIGVCAMITPWNWPIHQLACKIGSALAAGCTMVLKPSEIAPLSSYVFADIVRESGLPAGVFNLINGDGATAGTALASHPQVDMVSLTGSTRAGTAVMEAAAPTIKRVALELGGKSANIILADADFEAAVSGGVHGMMLNTGQCCNAPSRMLVPRELQDKAMTIARREAESLVTGDPSHDRTVLGPVASRAQWDKIQRLIKAGIDEGATVVTGGLGKPAELTRGYYVKPTIFANVRNDMTIAREEIFGPVLCILPYKDEDEAVRIANDTQYGLSGYVSGGSADRARAVAKRLRTGMVHLNGASFDFSVPFGGYKLSGNGREWGRYGLEEYLETKSLLGTHAA